MTFPSIFENLIAITQTSTNFSCIEQKAHTVIPAHLIAEAISTLHGLDLRWSGPITPTEMQYVQQYVFAKYPEYCNGLVEDSENTDLYALCVNEESSETTSEEKPKHSPKNRDSSSSPSFGNNVSDLDKTQLEPSRLLDVLTKKSSFQGNFISIPEIQESMMMVGESYPFFRGNYYMTIIGEEHDLIREFVGYKDSKVVAAPEAWLDLRIKGSQLSQYFRRKCKYSPKGLFSYPACVNERRYSMHWISEARRNSWHVLLDATGLDAGQDRLTLALHRPDFVVCTVDNTHGQPSKITCLLVRKRSFDTVATSP
ncbi:hypothetical protein Acr_29g0002980 [Actinidia rufa]|uniref:Pyridoxal phosphate (PLP)-dependent transferases superfamily protein n=1 Tax=Actinidia rufa TaxID=165716 RepID=A0A7J0HDF9_9ERIC|nr:hypothetical protein Acr_29g0002980 [Actinidia rufa]